MAFTASCISPLKTAFVPAREIWAYQHLIHLQGALASQLAMMCSSQRHSASWRAREPTWCALPHCSISLIPLAWHQQPSLTVIPLLLKNMIQSITLSGVCELPSTTCTWLWRIGAANGVTYGPMVIAVSSHPTTAPIPGRRLLPTKVSQH